MSGIVLGVVGSAGGNDPVSEIALTNQAVIDFNTGTASASYILDNDGKAYAVTSVAGTIELEQWCTPAANAALYEAFVTMTYGTLTSGTVGSWVTLGSDRAWTLALGAPGEDVAGFTVGIRLIGGDGTILTQATIDISALAS